MQILLVGCETLTPLHYAVIDSDIEQADFLIKSGADIDAFDKHQLTPLHYAVKNSDIETAEFLLKSGADVTKTSKDPKYGSIEAIWKKKFLEPKYIKDNTVLHRAVELNSNVSIDFIELFVKAGIDIDSLLVIPEFLMIMEYPAITLAARNGNLKIVKKLHELGAKLNIATSGFLVFVKEPLDASTEEGHEEIIKYLLLHGAKPL